MGIDGSIGFQVEGNLNIQEGGIVNDRYAYIGNNVASSGVAMVMGSGSQWNNSERIYVGNYGAGTLNVETGGIVSSSREGLIGYNAGSTGLATVTGLGSQWNNSNWLAVGYAGTGTLNVEAGGVVSNVLVGYIGGLSGSTGDATVTGVGSQWNNSGGMYVGLNGNGTLNVESGGKVESLSCFIGNLSGSTGLATVTGTGSQWNNAGDLWVGYAGVGTLNVEAGGVVANNLAGYIGGVLGNTGSATVTGSGSQWNNSGALSVGYGGAGTLNVEAGGVISDHIGYIGYDSGSTGQANVTDVGSQWNTVGNLFVGYRGHGTLIVEAGGVVYDANGFIGRQTGSTGVATVKGVGSTWNNLAVLDVGTDGDGTLIIEAGGVVSDVGGGIGSGIGSGQVTVTGTGSQWINSGSFIVGGGGSGTLIIETGGVVTNNHGYLGHSYYPAGPCVGTGLATVTGVGSTWNNSGEFHIGRAGTGTLNVESGGTVSSGKGYIATLSGSTGTVTVTGAGSQWNNSGDLSVGGSDTATGGNGSLSIMDSGLVYVGGMTRLWANGSLTLDSGGTLDTFELDLTLGSFNMLSGTLHATSIFGDLYNQSGVLAPGHSPGFLTIDGDYSQGAEATLQIELGGLNAGEFDALVINGNATLDGFLDISLYGGFALAQNQQFLIADVNGGLIGQYKDLGEGALVGTYGGTNLFITYNGFGGNAGVGLFTAVPEPGAAMFLGLIGLAGLVSCRFRRK